jgi:hypothetical protein
VTSKRMLEKTIEEQDKLIEELRYELDCRRVAIHKEAPYSAQVAVAAVILMLEDRAAHMAIRVGVDITEYENAQREIHDLRTFLDFSDDMICPAATAMWERLSS